MAAPTPHSTIAIARHHSLSQAAGWTDGDRLSPSSRSSQPSDDKQQHLGPDVNQVDLCRSPAKVSPPASCLSPWGLSGAGGGGRTTAPALPGATSATSSSAASAAYFGSRVPQQQDAPAPSDQPLPSLSSSSASSSSALAAAGVMTPFPHGGDVSLTTAHGKTAAITGNGGVAESSQHNVIHPPPAAAAAAAGSRHGEGASAGSGAGAAGASKPAATALLSAEVQVRA